MRAACGNIKGERIMDENEIKALKRKRLPFKIIGFVLLIAAIACIIWGFADFFGSFKTGAPPKLFWLFFVAFPFLPISGILIKKGTVRVIDESDPMHPGVTGGVKKCAYCGRKNPADALKCGNCGADLD
jgi:hypothetical protein